LCKQERKRPTSSAEEVKPDPRCFQKGHSRRVGAGVGDESTGSRSVVPPLRIPLMIRPERQTSDVVIRLTDELS